MKKHGLIRRLSGMLMGAALCASIVAGPMAVTAHADGYTYQATFYAGNHGRFTSGLDIRVNNRKTGSAYQIQRGSGGDKIVVSGLRRGDVVSLDVTASGAMSVDAGSPYYVKGLRDSGDDNSETGYGAFRVTRDQDFVVAYGMRSEETTYTVYYETSDGETLAQPRTYYGNVGDKPVAAYLYVEGYTPLAYNLAKTLSDDPAENVMTFIYVPEKGEDVVIHVPGPVIENHVSGGSYTVNVPGPVIVKPAEGTPSGGGVSDTGPVSGGTQQGGDQSQQGGTGTGNDSPSQNPSGGNQAQQGGNDNPSQPGGNQAQQGGNDNPSQSGGNQAQQGGNDNPAQSGGNQAQQGGSGTTTSPGGNLPGIGGHGSRGDGDTTASSGNGEDGQGGDTSDPNAAYKPGSSLDVVISSNYEPADVVDLDENPSGVPMGETPGSTGDDGNQGSDPNADPNADPNGGSDPAGSGMSENQEGTGTGVMEPDPKGFPIVPVIIGVIVVLAAAAGAVFFVYKKQQGAADESGEGE